MSTAKWPPFCFGLSVLSHPPPPPDKMAAILANNIFKHNLLKYNDRIQIETSLGLGLVVEAWGGGSQCTPQHEVHQAFAAVNCRATCNRVRPMLWCVPRPATETSNAWVLNIYSITNTQQWNPLNSTMNCHGQPSWLVSILQSECMRRNCALTIIDWRQNSLSLTSAQPPSCLHAEILSKSTKRQQDFGLF